MTGPNQTKLVARRLAMGGTGPGAVAWAAEAIAAARAAPGCPWTTDEEIAGALLRDLEIRPSTQGPP